MAKKPLQFQVTEQMRQEIENWVHGNEVTLSGFLRQSVRLYMILKNYTDQGYTLVLRKEDEKMEKEIILT
jgi:hypothetical protein